VGDGLPAAEVFRQADGREEADELLRRSSGKKPSAHAGCLQRGTPDWLSFFMFTYFTDRDGKMQLEAWRSRASTRCRAPAASC
jgi:hypothetical protein